MGSVQRTGPNWLPLRQIKSCWWKWDGKINYLGWFISFPSQVPEQMAGGFVQIFILWLEQLNCSSNKPRQSAQIGLDMSVTKCQVCQWNQDESSHFFTTLFGYWWVKLILALQFNYLFEIDQDKVWILKCIEKIKVTKGMVDLCWHF